MASKADNQEIILLPVVPVLFPKQAMKQSTCYRYLLGFQSRQSRNQLAPVPVWFPSRQSSNHLATATCLISKACNHAINLLQVPVPVWFPKQAIKQSTCYRYLFGFQSRQPSTPGNQLATGTCLVSKAGNQAINLLPVPVWFPKQAIKQSTCYRYLFGFQSRQSINQLPTGTWSVSSPRVLPLDYSSPRSPQRSSQRSII